ncbi:threonine dehydrogenase-like Zn-dependent dehydrogenase [Humitalea rosea]|uniref:Threonine dehydrogenase-like Zn-dependent dehydrogenase n=1 Tax=Humitalea rosea TaxID=990373 RepID=A0A2W7IGT8_9PROT|nr:zinc-binding alcohol dehydrogenase [Humitalea rosea]PZW45884.1 threonine dehydrogenase-like Zn-dependent dehydrogenase [Humitalea rosea]
MIGRAFWTIAAGQGELREERLPPRAPDQLLIRTLATAISRGTERLVFSGRVPETQWGAMACPLMAGCFPFPVKYGYAAVGVVEAGPEEMIGRRVFVLHPHQDRFLAPSAMCVPVPDAVPDRRAVLAANMETALNIIWDARPLPGERALVIGAGVVGLLVAHLLSRFPGMELTLCDADPSREVIARALGLRFCLPEAAPGDRELIVHASANPEGLRLALRSAGFEARIIEASWFGDALCNLPLGEAFHSRRLSLVSSQVGAVSPAMRGRRSYGERLALALTLLEDTRLDALLGVPTAFADLPARMGALLGLDGSVAAAPCPVVTYDA